jgi:hypothetical protein
MKWWFLILILLSTSVVALNSQLTLQRPPIEQELPAVQLPIPKMLAAPMGECGPIPTDGCSISVSTNFTPGSYYLPNGISFTADNISLDCKGATLVGNDSIYGNNDIQINGIASNMHNNIAIKNCNLSKYYTAIDVQHGKGITIASNQLFHLVIYNITDLMLISNNLFQSNTTTPPPSAYAAAITYLKNSLIQNNTFTNINYYVASEGLNMVSGCNVTIAANTFRNNSVGMSINVMDGNKAEGMNISDCSISDLVENNSFVNNSRKGIRKGSNPTWDVPFENLPTKIRKNVFMDNANGGIQVTGSIGTTFIEQNTFVNNRWYDVGLYAASERGNNVEIFSNNGSNDTSWYGIYIMGSTQGKNPSGNVSIHDNIFKNYYGGIFVDNNNAYAYNGYPKVDIYHNTFANSYIGIVVDTSTKTIIKENNVSSNNVGINLHDFTSDSFVYLNNIVSTSQGIVSNSPLEISYGGYGNYWGHASAPCFTAGLDSNRVDVIDSNPLCSPNNKISIAHPTSSIGWYFFSFNVQPDNASISSVLKRLNGKYEMVQSYLNGSAQKYIPGAPSSLTKLDSWHGYWIKINDTPLNAILILGNRTTGCHTQGLIAASTPKHWVGYWLDNLTSPSEGFKSINGKFEYIRIYENGVWKTYNPSFPQFSDLTTVKPGDAYLIKMTNPGTLDYGCN